MHEVASRTPYSKEWERLCTGSRREHADDRGIETFSVDCRLRNASPYGCSESMTSRQSGRALWSKDNFAAAPAHSIATACIQAQVLFTYLDLLVVESLL